MLSGFQIGGIVHMETAEILAKARDLEQAEQHAAPGNIDL